MGFFDAFRKKKTPPPGEPDAAAPELPRRGVIDRFEAGDGVGTIRLDDGPTVRFGASARRGDFVPAEGMPVQVDEVAPHRLGGFRATVVTATADTIAASDRLLDASLPLPGVIEAAATMTQLGLLTILLDVSMAPGRAAIRSILAPAVEAIGGRLSLADAMVKLALEGFEATLFVGAAPFPRADLDLRFWPEEREIGASFVGVQYGLPSLAVAQRRQTGSRPGEWDASGPMRQRVRALVALVEALGERAVGVVVHPAGNVASTPNAWLRRMGDVDDPEVRSFAGFVDLGMKGKTVFTQGMSAIELPDVEVDTTAFALGDVEAYERAQSAALFACHRMVFEDRLLESGEVLAVPLGVELGSRPIGRDNPGMTVDEVDEYVVRDDGATFALEPRGPFAPVARRWEKAVAEGRVLSYPAYRALLHQRLEEQGWRRVERMTFDRSELPDGCPEHEVLVMKRPKGDHATLTCGLARKSQPRGTVEGDNAHVELIVTLPSHHPRLAGFLSYLGTFFHIRGPADPPYAPEHRVEVDGSLAAAGFPFIVFGWAGKFELEHGPPICLYSPIPMTAAERGAVAIDQISDWIESTGLSLAEERWETFFAWKRA